MPPKVAPIIIIGMHRSGTSLVARMLEDLGVFIGKNQDQNHEARFFMIFNSWLLLQGAAAWDYPEPFQDFSNNEKFNTLAGEHIRRVVTSPGITNYLGYKKYIRYRSLANLDFAWGWKDPRNTYTLPLWLAMFPHSKVIHVYRQGVDVAHSLKLREDREFNHQTTFQYHLIRTKGIKKLNRLFYRYPHFAFACRRHTASLRCLSLEGSFTLWENYIETARNHVSQLGEAALEIKFEDLLTEPHSQLKTLVDFCQIQVDESIIMSIAETVNSKRAYAYRKSPELRDFAMQVSDRLKMQGYE